MPTKGKRLVERHSPEDTRIILQTQIDEYRHLRTQSLQVLRGILAFVALIIALVGSQTLTKDAIVPFLNSLGRAGSGDIPADIYGSLFDGYLLVGGSLGAIAVILLLVSVSYTYRLLSLGTPLPMLGSQGRNTIKSWSAGDREPLTSYSKWLVHNDNLLEEMRRQHQLSLQYLVYSGFVAIVGFLAVLTAYSGQASMFILTSLFIVFFPGALLLAYSFGFVRTGLKGYREGDLDGLVRSIQRRWQKKIVHAPPFVAVLLVVSVFVIPLVVALLVLFILGPYYF